MRTPNYLDLFHKPGLSRALAVSSYTALCALTLLAVLPATAGALSPSGSRADSSALRLSSAASSAKVAPMPIANRSIAKPALMRAVKPGSARIAAARPAAKAPVSRGRRAAGWLTALVSWYGPGFYGHTMAGGGTLRRTSMVVAHRTLPFGTRVMFSYKGKSVVAVVRDRGPYAGGRTFDLGPGTAKALGFGGVGRVRYRILGR